MYLWKVAFSAIDKSDKDHLKLTLNVLAIDGDQAVIVAREAIEKRGVVNDSDFKVEGNQLEKISLMAVSFSGTVHGAQQIKESDFVPGYFD